MSGRHKRAKRELRALEDRRDAAWDLVRAYDAVIADLEPWALDGCIATVSVVKTARSRHLRDVLVLNQQINAFMLPGKHVGDPDVPHQRRGPLFVDFGANPTREHLEAWGFDADTKSYREMRSVFDKTWPSATMNDKELPL